MSNYWANRTAKAQLAVANKSTRAINKQLRAYYKSLAQQVIDDYESVYLKILEAKQAGQQVTPADLYKLDKYWNMQSQLRKHLSKLSEKEVKLLTQQFELAYFDTYYAFNIEGLKAFSTIDDDLVKQVINQIWCADGKSWSQRVWQNTQLLQETLNEELVHCVVTGKKTTQLKKLLQERFNVSYSNANMLVRTEIAHIQTQAAQQRYKDYGIKEVEVLADKDERRCDVCGKLHGKRFPIHGVMPVPAHPNCRCCVVPVVEIPKDNVI